MSWPFHGVSWPTIPATKRPSGRPSARRAAATSIRPGRTLRRRRGCGRRRSSRRARPGPGSARRCSASWRGTRTLPRATTAVASARGQPLGQDVAHEDDAWRSAHPRRDRARRAASWRARRRSARAAAPGARGGASAAARAARASSTPGAGAGWPRMPGIGDPGEAARADGVGQRPRRAGDGRRDVLGQRVEQVEQRALPAADHARVVQDEDAHAGGSAVRPARPDRPRASPPRRGRSARARRCTPRCPRRPRAGG